MNVMSTSRDRLTRTLLLAFAGITSVALLIASIALLMWVMDSGKRGQTGRGLGNVVAVDGPSKGVAAVNAGTAKKDIKPVKGGGGQAVMLGMGAGFRV